VSHPREVGRVGAVATDRLAEIWLHVDNRCNIACAHCLVDSGPDGARGLATEEWFAVIADARALGARRFLITGGEPFLRSDLFEILAVAVADGCDAVVLTNGMLLTRDRLAALRDLERVRLQISIDGATVATNDALRGPDCFAKATACARAAIELGID